MIGSLPAGLPQLEPQKVNIFTIFAIIIATAIATIIATIIASVAITIVISNYCLLYCHSLRQKGDHHSVKMYNKCS